MINMKDRLVNDSLLAPLCSILLRILHLEQLHSSVRHVHTVLFPVPGTHPDDSEDQHDLCITEHEDEFEINIMMIINSIITLSNVVNSLYRLHT